MTIHPAFDPPPCDCDDPLCPALPSVEEVVDTVLRLAIPVRETEDLPLSRATGRILAGPTRALAEMPSFASAAMDGFALRLSDLTGPLPIAGTVLAGGGPCRLAPGKALAVMTGAMTPKGADTVIPSERARVRGGCLLPAPGTVAGAHVRPAGSDLRQGEIVVASGRRIGAAEAGALAAVGHGRVTVLRRIGVAFWTTGNELVEPPRCRHPAEFGVRTAPPCACCCRSPGFGRGIEARWPTIRCGCARHSPAPRVRPI